MYKTITQSNITFSIGKNAIGNFMIIDNSQPSDIWFHIHDKPSCHVIAHISPDFDKKSSEYKHIIKTGAILCKQHSKYKSEKISIVYTNVNNVTKTDVPGMVTTSNMKYINI